MGLVGGSALPHSVPLIGDMIDGAQECPFCVVVCVVVCVPLEAENLQKHASHVAVKHMRRKSVIAWKAFAPHVVLH